MYGMNYSGGDNCTHGQVERADRIDSFEAGKVEGWGVVTARRDGRALPLQCEHFNVGERETVKLLVCGPLELERVPSGFGGSRAFWVCPRCWKRARYLYFAGRDFVCRECAGLNYRSQQRTKDSINHVRDGLRMAQEKLRWDPPFPVAPMDFPHVVPDRPRYMHRATYYRLLVRFGRYQEKYHRDSLREMLAILRR